MLITQLPLKSILFWTDYEFSAHKLNLHLLSNNRERFRKGTALMASPRPQIFSILIVRILFSRVHETESPDFGYLSLSKA